MSDTHIYNSILIVGGGLIGSSFARACHERGAAKTVIITDHNAKVRSRLSELGVGDHVAEYPSAAAKAAAEADLVVLAVPPGVMGEAAKAVAGHMKKGAVLSDVGSVKESIIAAVTPHLPSGVVFIGGHPIAGTENSGPDAGFSSLFHDRWCILTPEHPNSAAAKKLASLWQLLGSRTANMDAKRHDLVLATTSHLPHLIAYTLVGTATDMEEVTRNEVVKYSAGGFRDFTRIAASDPVMWRDVFLGNKDGVLEVLERFIEDLTAMKRAIRWDEGDKLHEEFSKTRNIRRRIVDAGQDSAAPNFGRDHLEED